MKFGKSLSVLLAVTMFLAGPLAPIAWAQQAQPAQAATDEPDIYGVAAGFSNVFYAPGKFIVCAASVVLGVTAMGLTFGALYDESTRFVKGGCGGSWALTPADLKPAVEGQ
jgi:hypothetical protein